MGSSPLVPRRARAVLPFSLAAVCGALSFFLLQPSGVASEEPPIVVPPRDPVRVAEPQPEKSKQCPGDMVRVRQFCVDRYEASMVDKATGRSLSPYYPPHPRLLAEVFQAWEVERRTYGSEGARKMPLPEVDAFQRAGVFEAKAVSRARAVPQAYLPYPVAKRACENAGKRLCARTEWALACKGERQTRFPYGEEYERNICNVWSFAHPGVVLHQSATFGHRDPRLNLLAESGKSPLLKVTGQLASCKSRWGGDGAFDMVGNLDEWVDGDKPEDKPEFEGGFYARATKNGCESRVTNHAPMYYDYSVGTRCCRDAN
jgi:formylglycine-generating enzyme required for sulfatase activity